MFDVQLPRLCFPMGKYLGTKKNQILLYSFSLKSSPTLLQIIKFSSTTGNCGRAEVILDLSEPRTWLFYAMLLPSPRLGFRICDGNSISQSLLEIWYFIRQLSDIDRHRRMKWAKSGFLLPEAERIVSDGLLPNQITPPGITINCPSCFQGCTSF